MKYDIIMTSAFKKELKDIKKRNKDFSIIFISSFHCYKDLTKLTETVNKLARGEELDVKYRDHALMDNQKFKNCRECHIEPDWLLVYKKNTKELILFLIETGTHSDLF